MFDWQNPTVQMLGRWHLGMMDTQHYLNVLLLNRPCIMIRDMEIAENNLLAGGQVAERIQQPDTEGFTYNKDYVIIKVPNITNITYGRDVGYTITQEKLSEQIESISATKIRTQGL